MAGPGGGSLYLTYEGSASKLIASNLQQSHQRSNAVMRRTMDFKLSGPSSTLHMATDLQNRQLAVASRTVFKIFTIQDEGEIDGPGMLNST